MLPLSLDLLVELMLDFVQLDCHFYYWRCVCFHLSSSVVELVVFPLASPHRCSRKLHGTAFLVEQMAFRCCPCEKNIVLTELRPHFHSLSLSCHY